ncbi:hypothetical protein AAG747_09050 [Rapidithrix thailandica]|uniref:Transposase IS200-like domain-containing protein n=1 Tax=Rapidithrix thailandica TaxID=413964 RepID=A0AAW9S4P9_9BACT
MMQPSFQPEVLYHVYNHANGSENLFCNEGNYGYFLHKYTEYLFPVVTTFAYCLMPNHFHFLVQVRREGELLAFYKERFAEKLKTVFEVTTLEAFRTLQELKTDAHKVVTKQWADFLNGYTQALNRQQNRKGNLFQSNTKRKEVDNTAYYTHLVHYIHYNPVHHGFAKTMEEWEFSSYQTCLADKPTRLQREEVLDWFGGKEEYKKYHQSKPAEHLALEMEYQ